MPLPVALVVSLAAVLVVLVTSRPARADGLGGQWKQGPLREDFTVQQWLPGCGPAPVTNTSGGGETIQVREEGDELSFIGGGRVYHTNQCYDQMPTLQRASHSREGSGRAWRTRCTTPAGDPRYAALNTLVSAASDTHIDLTETGRYEITLKEGHCIADVKRTRAFDVVQAAAPAASASAPKPAPTQTAAPPPSNACAQPGEPARLEVRPSRKLLRPGESFSFQAVVRDTNGCATGTATTWAIGGGAEDGKKLVVTPGGKVTVPDDAPEGTVDVVATAAGKSTHVTIEIASAAHYGSLLAQSGLNSEGESEEASVAVIATGTLGGQDARAQGDAARRKTIFVAIVGTLATILAVLAVVGARRSRKAKALERAAEDRHARRVAEAEERRREKVAQHAAAMRAHEESVARAKQVAESNDPPDGGLVCPSCQREFPAGAGFCPHDGNKLVSRAGHEGLLAGPAGGVCPTCKRGFNPGIKVCPDDGDELVPYAMRAPGAPPGAPRGKICPTCGQRFDGTATFCGKDGTALVLVN